MRRPLGASRHLAGALAVLLALAAGLVGCGSGDDPEPAPAPPSDTPSGAGSPSPEAAPSTAPSVPQPVGEDATLLSETAAGGETSEVAVRLDGLHADAGLAALTADLHGRLTEKVVGVVESMEVPPGHELYGAVVAVGCDVPPGISVERRGDRVRLVPRKARSQVKECYAPVTTVAVVPVPAA